MNNLTSIIILIIVTIIIIFALTLAMSGCNSGWTWPGQKPSLTLPDTPSGQLWLTVRKSNWLVTLAIPIIALGAVAMFNGAAKLGMSAIIFGAVNLFMALATARFALWMSVFGLIGSGLAVAASILVKNKALKEIICGVQKYKQVHLQNVDLTNIHNELGGNQTSSTQRIVQNIKTNLKLKGEI